MESINPHLVCDINTTSVVEAITHFYDLPIKEKLRISQLAKTKCQDFTGDKAVEEFQSIIKKIVAN